jgi:hypothetical protein
MIIWINATVCAAGNHGADGWHKIAGRNQGKEAQEGCEGGSDLGKQKTQELCGK